MDTRADYFNKRSLGFNYRAVEGLRAKVKSALVAQRQQHNPLLCSSEQAIEIVVLFFYFRL